jgi:hypothetical protein
MKKSIVGVTAIWIAAAVSAASLIYKLNHPLGDPGASNAIPASAPADVASAQTVDSVIDTPEPAVLVLPVVTITSSRRGTAEMQAPDELTTAPTAP